MNQGDVILPSVPQADGRLKNRPAIILREWNFVEHRRISLKGFGKC